MDVYVRFLRKWFATVLLMVIGLHPATPPVQAATVNDVSVGTYFGCAVTAGSVYCWGRHDKGQLGSDQAPGVYPGAVRVVLSDGTPLTGVSQLASSGEWTCALKSGQVWCWGGSSAYDVAQRNGSLSGGQYINDAVALAVGGNTGGAPHVCVIRSSQSRSIWCWGNNSSGQLGLNHTRAPADTLARQVLTSSGAPLSFVPLTNAQGLSAGGFHTCATVAMANPKLGNYVYCWGNNGYGQIGNGRSGVTEKALTATQLKTAAGVAIGAVSSVSAGYIHSCALMKNTEVMCWGYGLDYQLGQGAQTSSTRALSVKTNASTKLTGVTAVDAGDKFTCAIKNTDIWCWGTNTYGQFGDSLYIPAQYAVRTVTTILDVVDIDTTKYNVCAVNGTVASSRKVYCVGENDHGQLGNRTLVDSTVHVAVKFHTTGATFP
jgi:alpha-tubulin suppressor-like RCC1 family protein